MHETDINKSHLHLSSTSIWFHDWRKNVELWYHATDLKSHSPVNFCMRYHWLEESSSCVLNFHGFQTLDGIAITWLSLGNHWSMAPLDCFSLLLRNFIIRWMDCSNDGHFFTATLCLSVFISCEMGEKNGIKFAAICAVIYVVSISIINMITKSCSNAQRCNYSQNSWLVWFRGELLLEKQYIHKHWLRTSKWSAHSW